MKSLVHELAELISEEYMSRSQDAAALQKEIIALEAKMKQVVDRYNEYRDDVDQMIEDKLEEAGILDDVKALRAVRDEAMSKAQGTVNQVQMEMAQKQQMRQWLLGKDEEETAATKKAAKEAKAKRKAKKRRGKKGSKPELVEEEPQEEEVPEELDDAGEEAVEEEEVDESTEEEPVGPPPVPDFGD